MMPAPQMGTHITFTFLSSPVLAGEKDSIARTQINLSSSEMLLLRALVMCNCYNIFRLEIVHMVLSSLCACRHCLLILKNGAKIISAKESVYQS